MRKARVFDPVTMLGDLLTKLSEEWCAAETCNGDEAPFYKRLNILAKEFKTRLPASLDYPLNHCECGELKTRLEALGTRCMQIAPSDHVEGSRVLSRRYIGLLILHFEALEDALWT